MSEPTIRQRSVETNGIRMHLAEAGEGPAVVLLHGFPEGWSCWRRQLVALAEAGYHALAPDLRGYGGTDRPAAAEAYSIFELVADVIGLLDAVDADRAVVVGHDWGAQLAWHCALLRPDRVRGLGLLGVPYKLRTWDEAPPLEAMDRMAGDQVFYISYFQEPGVAETELEADLRDSLLKTFHGAGGDAPPEHRWRFVFPRGQGVLSSCVAPDRLPSWLSAADLDDLVRAFSTTGLTPALNWYRCIPDNWERTAFLTGARIEQPSFFVAGELDPVLAMLPKALEALSDTMTDLRALRIEPGAGHWIQRERPDELNETLLDFLQQLAP